MQDEKDLTKNAAIIDTDYDVPKEQEISIEKPKVDVEKLPPIEQLMYFAEQHNVKMHLPDGKCRKSGCWGRGYTGFDPKNHMPIPCSCIFDKEDVQRERQEIARGNVEKANNHKQRRKIKQLANRKSYLKAIEKDNEKIRNDLVEAGTKLAEEKKKGEVVDEKL